MNKVKPTLPRVRHQCQPHDDAHTRGNNNVQVFNSHLKCTVTETSFTCRYIRCCAATPVCVSWVDVVTGVGSFVQIFDVFHGI